MSLLSGEVPTPKDGKATFLHIFRILGFPDSPFLLPPISSWLMISPQILPVQPGEELCPVVLKVR